MNKLLKIVLICVAFIGIVNKANSMTFEEAYEKSYSKPGVVLVYAKWAEGAEGTLKQYRQVANYLKSIYNFSELDLASEDAKFFNTKYDIYKNLPYAMTFRDGGKICRYIPRECSSDAKCLAEKLKSFIK